MKTVWQRLVILNGCHIGWGYSYPYASQDSGGIFVWILLTWWTNLGNFIAIIISQWPKKWTALFISKMLLTGLARLGFQGWPCSRCGKPLLLTQRVQRVLVGWSTGAPVLWDEGSALVPRRLSWVLHKEGAYKGFFSSVHNCQSLG